MKRKAKEKILDPYGENHRECQYCHKEFIAQHGLQQYCPDRNGIANYCRHKQKALLSEKRMADLAIELANVGIKATEAPLKKISTKKTPAKEKEEMFLTFESLQKEIDNVKPTILDEAKKAVYGDRQADYGNVTESFTITAKMWSAILSRKLKYDLSPEDVGLMMAALKIARCVNKIKRDSLVDLCGYSACLEKLQNGE